MNPTQDGPEHIPLPARTRGEMHKTGGAYRDAGITQTVVAMMAIAFSGVGVWFASGHIAAPPAPAPAAMIAPRLAAPALVAPALAAPAFPAVLSETPAPFYAPSPTATDAMPMVAPQAAPKPCPLCDRAQDPLGAFNEQTLKNIVVKASDFKGVQVSIVGSGEGALRVNLVGPCAEGFLYRLTNTLHHSVGPMAVEGEAGVDGTNISYWVIKGLKPGESAEIRSPSSILGISYKSL